MRSPTPSPTPTTNPGFLDPATLNQNPGLRLLYQQNGVFLFAVEPSLESQSGGGENGR